MDGTFADTEPVWLASEASYVQKRGKEWGVEDALELVGGSALATTTKLIEKTGSADTHDEVFAYLLDYLMRTIEAGEVKMRPGALELALELKEAGVPIALVTSSVRPMVEAMLKHVPAGLFDAVVTADDVASHKPSPEPYLLAMKLLGVEPSGCVVLEDSMAGVTSGLAAGAAVVAIPCVAEIEEREGLNWVESAAHLDLDLLGEIVAGRRVDYRSV